MSSLFIATELLPQLQIRRDKNHPSIIVWSCGNESGFGTAHSDMAKFYRQLDPSRPTHYEVQHPFQLTNAAKASWVLQPCNGAALSRRLSGNT